MDDASSKIVAFSVCGKTTWQVKNYSRIPKTPGNYVVSERFEVGGHEWVLLFYPGGKRPETQKRQHTIDPHQAAQTPASPWPTLQQSTKHKKPAEKALQSFDEHAAIFVSRIGSGKSPQGIVTRHEKDGAQQVVRGFHTITLISKRGRSITKQHNADGEGGPVRLRCDMPGPDYDNTATRWGARKFVKRKVLENPESGFLTDDTLEIRYNVELLVSSGGILATSKGNPIWAEPVPVLPSTIRMQLAQLFKTGRNSDFTIVLAYPGYQQQQINVHRIILQARCPFFKGMLSSSMAEAQQGRFILTDVAPPAAKAMLHFIYTDSLPDAIAGKHLESVMATHLLAAADMYQLPRLSKICEKRLCETADVPSAALMLALAEQHCAEELKSACFDLAAKNFEQVTRSEGFDHLQASCPELLKGLLLRAAELGDKLAAQLLYDVEAHLLVA